MRVAVTGADGALGARVVALLGGRDVRPIDRVRGHELADPATYEREIARCDAVVHTAALHPLVAPAGTTTAGYREANVVPFRALLDVMRRQGVPRLVLASSTSVWLDASPGQPARFIDESTLPDAQDGYAASKRECERMARAFLVDTVVLRLARFARRGDAEDEVRLLYRAVDPDDAATATVLALDHAPAGGLYAISAPSPFRPEDAARLGSDAPAVIRERTGREPRWAPARIGSVVVAERAIRDLGWRPAHASPLISIGA